MHGRSAPGPDDGANEYSDDDDSSSNDLPCTNPRRTETDQMMTKARLTTLSITAVRRHVEHIDAVTDINANGTATSIQEWASIMFTNPDTIERDLSQQRAFEVIVGMFVMTFHDEAERNEG